MTPATAAWVIGESIIDIVRAPRHTTDAFGGSPRNVAFGLARLGVPTRLSTQIGLDPAGGHLLQDLQSAGVQVSESSLTRRPTSTAIAHVNDAGDAAYKFEIEWQWQREAPPHGVSIVHTGSIATALAPGAEQVLATFTDLHARSADAPLLSFDPNIRPALMDSAAQARGRVLEFAELVDVVKMSDEDAAWLHPGATIDEVVALYLHAGARLVVVTLGARGCALSAGGEMISLPAMPVQVVDTIGGGDAFMSGMLFALLRLDLRGALRRGAVTTTQARLVARTAMASARATVARAGALPPTLDEIWVEPSTTVGDSARRSARSNS